MQSLCHTVSVNLVPITESVVNSGRNRACDEYCTVQEVQDRINKYKKGKVT
jgi:hypothetical protein